MLTIKKIITYFVHFRNIILNKKNRKSDFRKKRLNKAGLFLLFAINNFNCLTVFIGDCSGGPVNLRHFIRSIGEPEGYFLFLAGANNQIGLFRIMLVPVFNRDAAGGQRDGLIGFKAPVFDSSDRLGGIGITLAVRIRTFAVHVDCLDQLLLSIHGENSRCGHDHQK